MRGILSRRGVVELPPIRRASASRRPKTSCGLTGGPIKEGDHRLRVCMCKRLQAHARVGGRLRAHERVCGLAVVDAYLSALVIVMV